MRQVTPSQHTRVKPADDWVREEVRALLRGNVVAGYPYDAVHDLDDAIAAFAMRQSAYDASIASGVRRLHDLARALDYEPAARAPSLAAMASKRLFDIIFSAASLVLLAPLLVAIAVAIKLDSPGPVLFRQARVGRRAENFRIIKFRTMVANAEAPKADLRGLNEAADVVLFKMADDPRVTRVGRFLRRSSLDGLPQLLNVLKGEMSVVGPRPLIVEVAVLIEDREQHPSTALKPGMTGVGRLRHRSLEDELVLEDEYASRRWSIALDLGVAVRSLSRLWRGSY
jgi:lipopolysaccharide/colanic/teichoic acid biosynthesis glycosyltransferase